MNSLSVSPGSRGSSSSRVALLQRVVSHLPGVVSAAQHAPPARSEGRIDQWGNQVWVLPRSSTGMQTLLVEGKEPPCVCVSRLNHRGLALL